MDKQTFINKAIELVKITETDRILNNASKVIKDFFDNLDQKIKSTEYDKTDYIYTSGNISTTIYLKSSKLEFYREENLIAVKYNNELIDNLIVSNNNVISENNKEVISEELLETYLDNFSDLFI